MFEDRLQETIMSEMMETFGADVRTDAGSLAYNACAKIAEKLEEIYGDMDEINDNLLPDTQDLQHLIDYGADRGIKYKYATCPVVKGTFNQAIEVGERFTCNDYSYEVTELISGYNYKLTCDTEGTEANTNFGELEPLDYIDDYLGGSIVELIQAGTDDEDEEIFRQKVIGSFQSKGFGGNKAEYRELVNAIQGVGGCKPKRRGKDSEWINIYVLSSDYGVPSGSLISEMQTLIDPEENSGEGDGMAPIGHKVKIYAVQAVMVDITATVVFDTGYGIESSKTLIEEAIEDYMLSLRKSWEAQGDRNITVRVAQIEARILNVTGVLDVSGTTLNGSAENLEVSYQGIPVLGGVVINV